MTTAFTALLYDDVAVSGSVLPNAPNPLILSDQGKPRAEGSLELDFHQSNNLSYFLQTSLQGGQGLFAAGGKIGMRLAW
jgi:hypothetical protein